MDIIGLFNIDINFTWLLWAFILFGYTYTTKVNRSHYVDASHVNLLQTEKLDRDGAIPLTGDLDLNSFDLQNIMAAWFNAEYNNGNSGNGAKAIDFSNGQKQKVTLTGDPTFSFTFPGCGHYLFRMINDGIGGRDPSWPGANWTWIDNTEPIWSTVAAKVNVVTIYYDGTDAWAGGNKFA